MLHNCTVPHNPGTRSTTYLITSQAWLLVRKSERECVVENYTLFDEGMLLSLPPAEPYQVLKIDATLLAVPI